MSNPNPKQQVYIKELVFLLLSTVFGGLAGGFAGFYASTIISYPPIVSAPITATSTGLKVVAPTSTFALVQVERPSMATVVPSAFLKRRASAVGTLYRAPKASSLEERMLTDERLLGQAVALTSDGWFITTASAVTNLKTADFVLWYGGEAYKIERGLSDRLNSTVYLKVAAKDVAAASFAHAQDLLSGTEAWSESRPGQLAPHVILDIGGRSLSGGSVSSEIADRRILLDGMSAAGDQGSGIWDANGQLIGLAAGSEAAGQIAVIPATSIASSLASLLGTGEIRHAYLGVHVYDLARLKLGGDRRTLPIAGALISDDKKANKPGVVRDSPAAKAKIQANDVILKVERDILDGTADLGEVLSEYRPGSEVTLRIQRDQKDLDVKVVLGEVVTSELLK